MVLLSISYALTPITKSDISLPYAPALPKIAPPRLPGIPESSSSPESDALEQIAEEGGASVFKPVIGSEWVVGVVGPLQFEVMADRIRTEFNIQVIFEPTQYYTARWIECDDSALLQKFLDSSMANIADDHDGAKVFLARNAWHLGKVAEDFPKIVLKKTREQIF